jgi:hypothetical protein
MKPNAVKFLLSLLLALSSTTLFAQSSDSVRYEKDPAFWSRFEKEVDKFVDRAVNGFSDAEEQIPEAAMDTTHTWAWDSCAAYDNSSDYQWSARYGSRKFMRYGVPKNVSWLGENTLQDHLILRYNRVESLFLGLGSEKRYYWEDGREFNPFGSIGYGFGSHRWRYDLGVTRQIALGTSAMDRLMEVGVEGYSLTDSKDQWRISTVENTLASFFIHEDFRDYFGREGVTLHTAYLLRDREFYGEARVAYSVDRYRSLDNGADWALFGGKKSFRDNPQINDGTMRSITALAGFSTASAKRYGLVGWNIYASAEFAGAGLGGNFRFQQYNLDVRRYQPLGRHDNLNIRFRAGTSHGYLPMQKAYEIGGLGTLPAYGFKDLPGDSLGANRMLLMNAEYILNGDFLGDLSFWPSWLMRHINLILLADAGLVRTSSPTTSVFSGFEGITANELRSDAGIGISNRSGSFRLAAVWRTDRSEPARLVFRVEAPF